MADLYGSFLVKGHDNYATYYDKYKKRIDSLNSVAEITKNIIISQYPSLEGHIAISYTNIVLATTRYFNDVIRIKAMHKIQILNKSKMFSYMTKWVSSNPVLVCTIDDETFKKLTVEERKICMNLNHVFIGNIATYFFRSYTLGIDSGKARAISNDIKYLLKTSLFEEHCVAGMLSQLTVNEKL